MARLSFAASALVALALVPRPAFAEGRPLPLELEWEAPPECHTPEMIHAELARIAHVRPGRTPTTLTARVRIDRRGERYRLSLKTEHDGHVGERTLAASECSALGREVTLVLALAFGEGVELGPGEPEPDPAPPEPPKPKPAAAPPKPPPAPPEDARSSGVRGASTGGESTVALVAGGGVLLRALPNPAVHAFAGADIGTRRFWLAPRLMLLPRVRDELERDVEARYDAAGGSLAACLGTRALSSLFAACVAGGVMAVRGRSRGAPVASSAVAPWYTAGPAVSAAWPDGGAIQARLEGSVLVSLNTPTFRVEGLRDVHTIPRLAPGAALGVVFRL